MSDLVPAETVERIVGAARDDVLHLGIAVSKQKTVYVLHSARCLTTHSDLRDCRWSVALDRGILKRHWRRHEDRTVALRIVDGHLAPVVKGDGVLATVIDRMVELERREVQA